MVDSNWTSDKTKIALVILDKLVIAVIVVVVAFFMDSALQREEVRGTYQQEFFQVRVQAYVAILEKAKRARDSARIVYGSRLGAEAPGSIGRKNRLHKLRSRASQPSGFGSSTWAFHGEIVNTLIEIEDLLNENELYISSNAKNSVYLFVDTIARDIEAALERDRPFTEQAGEKSDRGLDHDASSRAEVAYQNLLREFRQVLEIDGIAIG